MKEIPLTNSPLLALVDDEDYPVLSRHRWRIEDGGYAITDMIRMHVLIMGRRVRYQVDHADRNKLNNQKSNLRFVIHRYNTFNKPAHRDSSTGFKGVYKRDCLISKPWMATIGGKHIGYFASAEQAAQAYDAKARELYGEYAYQNLA